jgi:hypothetical protein
MASVSNNGTNDDNDKSLDQIRLPVPSHTNTAPARLLGNRAFVSSLLYRADAR